MAEARVLVAQAAAEHGVLIGRGIRRLPDACRAALPGDEREIAVIAQSDESTRWTRGAVVAAVSLAGILIFQFLVPLVLLRADRPARFGWQMYSGIRESVRYEVVLIGDSVLPVKLRDYVVQHRADLQYADRLVPHLCREVSGARAVRLVASRDAVEVVTCD